MVQMHYAGIGRRGGLCEAIIHIQRGSFVCGGRLTRAQTILLHE